MTTNPTNPQQAPPLIAITSDLMIRNDRPTAFLTMTYVQAVQRAGGIPVVLPPMEADDSPQPIAALIERFDGFILSGGDDPKTEPFGCPTHDAITPVLDARQAFETALLAELSEHSEIPVLGICLGMQMMALCSGGRLNQHLPDTHENHAIHWEHPHEIRSHDQMSMATGTVYSKHRQAVEDPGSMRVLAQSTDGVIEAIDDPERAYTVGVQWHPERTEDQNLGQGIIDALVAAAWNRSKSN